jgi:two-component system nitrogen regulation response regulator GlnG
MTRQTILVVDDEPSICWAFEKMLSGDGHVVVTPKSANIRILAATNCDLHQAVSRGEFREDLYHRLTGMQIHLPPLRERTEDIAPLCEYFLAAMGYGPAAIDQGLLEKLQLRPWHGNIRELRNAIEHATVVARGRALTIDDFPAIKPGRDEASVSSDSSLVKAEGATHENL